VNWFYSTPDFPWFADKDFHCFFVVLQPINMGAICCSSGGCLSYFISSPQ
jgi:hypothetical protein